MSKNVYFCVDICKVGGPYKLTDNQCELHRTGLPTRDELRTKWLYALSAVSSLDWGTFIALYSLPSSGPDLMNPSLWTFELIITVWGQWAQLNLYCAAPSWFSMHGAFPLALRGKSTQWEPIRWDNNTNPAQSLAHWNQMNKNQLPNSMRFPSCYTNQNKDQSSMGFPHATPTTIKNKIKHEGKMQDGCETKMVGRWDECEVT